MSNEIYLIKGDWLLFPVQADGGVANQVELMKVHDQFELSGIVLSTRIDRPWVLRKGMLIEETDVESS